MMKNEGRRGKKGETKGGRNETENKGEQSARGAKVSIGGATRPGRLSGPLSEEVANPAPLKDGPESIGGKEESRPHPE